MGRVVKNCSSTYSHDSDSSELFLNQDLMLPILTLLPLNSLLNSARYVCKQWATTIRTSHFAQACLRLSKPGLYVENRCFGTRSYYLHIKNYANGQFEFERTDLGTPLIAGMVIDSCNGILLMLCWTWDPAQTQAFLVNPVVKSCLKLPPLPLFREGPLLASQFNIVCVPRTAKFKLFFIDIVEVSGAFYYVFYVLTIGVDNLWKEIDRKEAPVNWDNIWKPLYDGANYLYWISMHHEITVLDVDKEIIVGKFPLPPLPVVEPRSLTTFLWKGNQLSCTVRSLRNETYQIYILDFDSGKWSFYHEMGPFDYVAACGLDLVILLLLFRYWIHDQIIFRVVIFPRTEENWPRGKHTMHFSYNVNTRQLTKIEDIAMGSHEVWLHTNSLVSLPSIQHS